MQTSGERKAPSMHVNEIVPGYILTVSELLSRAECQALIEEAEEARFRSAPFVGAGTSEPLASTTRVKRHLPVLGRRLWRNLRSIVPASLEGATAVSLDPWFTTYRFRAGQRRTQQSQRHRPQEGGSPRLGLLVYLNDDFTGGATHFRRLRVPARTGTALLFRQELRHEAARLYAGTRYVLHSEVLYQAPVVEGGWDNAIPPALMI